MTDDATIHLRVPASLKSRWVRESRAAGMRLTDWIIQNVERNMPKAIPINIPADLDFSELKLARDPDGMVSFDQKAIETIEQASGIAAGFFMSQPEDAVSSVIFAWYRHHLSSGGAPDATAEDLIAEVRAEDAAGQYASHPPGRA